MIGNRVNFKTLAALKCGPKGFRFAVGILAFATIVVPATLSFYDYEPVQLVLAMVLLDVCIYPILRHLLLNEGLPVLPIICASFAVQFATPIFTQEPGVPLSVGFRYLENEEIVAALCMSILGLVVMEFAYYGFKRISARHLIPAVKLELVPQRAELYCVVVFALSFIASRLPE